LNFSTFLLDLSVKPRHDFVPRHPGWAPNVEAPLKPE
jgi:hypothetical protein